MKRTRKPYKIGEYVTIPRERYDRLLVYLDTGTFHSKDSGEKVTIKVINKPIQQALQIVK